MNDNYKTSTNCAETRLGDFRTIRADKSNKGTVKEEGSGEVRCRDSHLGHAGACDGDVGVVDHAGRLHVFTPCPALPAPVPGRREGGRRWGAARLQSPELCQLPGLPLQEGVPVGAARATLEQRVGHGSTSERGVQVLPAGLWQTHASGVGGHRQARQQAAVPTQEVAVVDRPRLGERVEAADPLAGDVVGQQGRVGPRPPDQLGGPLSPLAGSLTRLSGGWQKEANQQTA